MKNNLKKKAKLANVAANSLNAIINWQPFNIKPMRAMYKWAHKVRSNDPAWTEFLQKQFEEAAAPKRSDEGSDPGSVLAPA